MSPAAVQRKLQGRRCDALMVYEAYDSAGLVDGVAMLVLGLDQGAATGEWVRVFFDAGRWSWTASTEPPRARLKGRTAPVDTSEYSTPRAVSVLATRPVAMSCLRTT